jgi:DNA-binding MarR family transcriptional regulator
MTAQGRAANVLGALSLVITDQTVGAVGAATGQSASAAAALSALLEFLDRPTLDDLRKVLGLTPSGAVRLVDRLAETGLVTREAGSDGRSRSVVLTEKGRRLAGEMSKARMDSLTGAIDGLTEQELDGFHRVLSRVMANVVNAKDGGPWICRLCNFDACERPLGHCPAALAAKEKYGSHSRAPDNHPP